MASLWRTLALAWLGGIASPALTEDPFSSEIAAYEQASSAVDDREAVAESTPGHYRIPDAEKRK
jgi:hypothetical protein